ncbi:hypothetical protein J4229_01910 [Candidatus Pacearchaeota archaeon]|nr:hypothetical protein [Candidatus Pacearchaeota archaeon]
MAVDISLIQDFLPILSFLLIFAVVFALLAKYKLLGEESKFLNLFVSFLIAAIFVSLTSARDYVLAITPWFVVFVLISLFIFVLVGFAGEVPKGFKTGIGVVLVIALLLAFLISAYFTFSSESFFVSLANWVSKPRIYGAFLLVALGALVSWILAKAK